MAHFGLLCPAVAGHLNPMTTLGHELKHRGHRVTLVGTPDAQSKTLAAGLEFQVIGESAFPLGSLVASLSDLGKLSGFAAFRYTVDIFKKQTSLLLQEAPETLRNAGVDALLVDQTSFGGSTIADCLDLPFVSVSCALMINRESYIPPFHTLWRYSRHPLAKLRNKLGYGLITQAVKPITGVVAEYRQERRLPTLNQPEDGFSQLAQLCQQPPEFEFPRQQLPKCFHFTGPYSNLLSREPASFPFEKLTDRPLIYASLGTIQNRLLFVFEAIAEACLSLDAQLVIALGGGMRPEEMPNLPGSPLVMGYVPQLEILKRTSLTITHAGLNTTLESLSNGVPMVAIPIANDQPGVATRIAWTGTGEVVPLKGINSSKLRAAIQKVLGNPSYKENALRLQQSINRAGGAKRAADIVEKVISSGQPVLTN